MDKSQEVSKGKKVIFNIVELYIVGQARATQLLLDDAQYQEVATGLKNGTPFKVSNHYIVASEAKQAKKVTDDVELWFNPQPIAIVAKSKDEFEILS